MTDYDDLVALWGQDMIIHFPIDQLGDVVTCGPDPFPPDGALPIEVPLLFTTALDGQVKLFSVLTIHAGDSATRLVVIGGAPDDDDLLFCLDPATGAVGLLQFTEPALEHVNASLKHFVEFLYRISRFIGEGHRGAQRVSNAHHLRHDLTALDPTAFTDTESWWAIAFDHGLARP